jgi:hypothetical protein
LEAQPEPVTVSVSRIFLLSFMGTFPVVFI